MDAIKVITILYIDDSGFDLVIFNGYLSKIPEWEIEYLPYVSEEEGMKSLKTRTFDLIFLDYFLATTIAPDIISSLRDAGCKTPIIVISARNFDDVMIDKIKNAGGDLTYIKKKFDEKIIEFIIYKYLNADLYLPLETEKQKELSQLSIIYEDGRLIQNYMTHSGKLTRDVIGNPKPHLFASSLVAINQFLQEAAQSDSPFQEIQSEDITLMIERGRWIAIAVITKTANPYIRYQINKMVIEIENMYQSILENWKGDLSGLNMDPFAKQLDDYAI